MQSTLSQHQRSVNWPSTHSLFSSYCSPRQTSDGPLLPATWISCLPFPLGPAQTRRLDLCGWAERQPVSDFAHHHSLVTATTVGWKKGKYTRFPFVKESISYLTAAAGPQWKKSEGFFHTLPLEKDKRDSLTAQDLARWRIIRRKQKESSLAFRCLEVL